MGAWISACAPGEFEPQAAIVLGLNDLVWKCPHLVVQVIGALIERIPLVGIVGSEEQRQELLTELCDWGVPAHRMRFVFMPVQGAWVRDYGPAFARWSDGTIAILDADYYQSDRPNDDKVPSALAKLLRLPVIRIPLMVDGGLILGNGQGLCLTTGKLLARNVARFGEQGVHLALQNCYGFNMGIALYPLDSEMTGHVDIFATFTAADCLVLGRYDPKADAVNAAILDRNAELMKGVRTRSGPLRIVRIPMPSNQDGIFRTYTNVVYANGALLVPSYPDQDEALEKQAMGIYAELLPGWDIVPIDCSELIKAGGALRCMSVNIPWLADRFEGTGAVATEKRGTEKRGHPSSPQVT